MANVLCPLNGYRGELENRGIKPKDHRRDNLKCIKDKQILFKKKQEESLVEAPEPFKLKKFQKVESKL